MRSPFRLATLATAVAVMAALMVPVAASAAPASSSTSPTVAANKHYVRLVRRTIAVQRVRFNVQYGQIATRLKRQSAVARYVVSKGGDVTTATASIAAARAHLKVARQYENQAIAQLKAVPTAADPKAAFAEAKATIAKAMAELKAARADRRAAGIALGKELRRLHLTRRYSLASVA
jgi:hypothetical protein